MKIILSLLASMATAVSLAQPSPLHIVGTQILDANNRPVLLRGVNAASMEWTVDGEGHILETVKVAVEKWHSNIVRIPLSQDRWFGQTPEQKDKGAAYRALVAEIVKSISDKNAYVILDLHWNDANVWGKYIGQHPMPDKNSVTFWKDCARTYRNNPAVIFDLYNEPYGTTWDIWRDGGTITERATRDRPALTYEAVGMPELFKTVRSTGAKNIVLVGGLDWSYDMSGFLKGYAIKETSGNGIIYANHAYPFKGDKVEQWIAKMNAATKVLPVIVSEWGSDINGGAGLKGDAWVKQMLAVMTANKWNWTAWDMHPAASPILLADWKYTPTPWFGQQVLDALSR